MPTAQLRDALAKAHDPSANSVAELQHTAHDAMSDVGSRGRELLDRAGQSAGNAYGVARKGTVNGAGQAWDFVRERPYTAVAIAAGLGVLVGGLLWASRRD